MVDIAGRIAEELGISLTQVNNVINYLMMEIRFHLFLGTEKNRLVH